MSGCPRWSALTLSPVSTTTAVTKLTVTRSIQQQSSCHRRLDYIEFWRSISEKLLCKNTHCSWLLPPNYQGHGRTCSVLARGTSEMLRGMYDMGVFACVVCPSKMQVVAPTFCYFHFHQAVGVLLRATIRISVRRQRTMERSERQELHHSLEPTSIRSNEGTNERRGGTAVEVE